MTIGLALKTSLKQITPDHIIVAAGLVLFGLWLLRTSWGRSALKDARSRRNDLPPYIPVLLMFVWFGPVPVLIMSTQQLTAALPPWRRAMLGNICYCLCALVVVAATIYLARAHFSRRLKGFGLDLKRIPRDLAVALIYLAGIWPLVMTAILVTIQLGKTIRGPDFQIPQHRELELLVQNPQLPLRITIVAVAVVMAPLVEELLFRGMLQSTIRSLLIRRALLRHALTWPSTPSHPLPYQPPKDNSAWPAIALTAMLFAMVHSNVAHWPALFILGLGLGYTYEKSSSLFRAIFLHAFFNTATIIAALFQ